MHYRQSLCKLLLRVHKCELTAYDTYCASHYLYIGRNVHRLYYAVGRARKLSSTIVFGSVDTVDLNSRKKKKNRNGNDACIRVVETTVHRKRMPENFQYPPWKYPKNVIDRATNGNEIVRKPSWMQNAFFNVFFYFISL